MRTVTLTGTMRLYTLFQTPSTTLLENLVKARLLEYGWGVISVSITRNSWFNNTLNVVIKIDATANDVSQRIDDSLTIFLSAFEMDGENPFTHVNLQVTADTGAYSEGATGAQGYVRPVINGGTLAVVTVRGDEGSSGGGNTNSYYQDPNKKPVFEVSPVMIVAGFLLLVLVTRD